MDFPNAKALKKLADSCRKAGIKSFKQGDLEFTLTEDAPVSNYKKKVQVTKPATNIEAIDKNFQSDDLSQEQLLFWSTGAPSDETESEDTGTQ